MSALLPPERIARFAGFGMASAADGYAFPVRSTEELREALTIARAAGRQVTLRGAGRSYGDAAIGSECAIVDVTPMRRLLNWDARSGVLEAEAGFTIEGLWRCGLPHGWWPPVVSGTMFPTLAGALAMNIHGKNNFKAGTLGEHVLELELMMASGELRVLTPEDPLFFAAIGSAGLLGAITRVKLQMRPVASGMLRVRAVASGDWGAQFAAFERFEGEADYAVSWVDGFAVGAAAGRGLFHAAWYDERPDPDSLRLERQDLPPRVLGLVPKSQVWRALRVLNRPGAMRAVNAAKAWAARRQGEFEHPQSLVAFSFLLDYVPNWRNAYRPGGFIQYQSFVPKADARRVFARQVALAQEAGEAPFLAVLKRHRPDPFLLSHGVDGYSLALDFKVVPARWEALRALSHRLNDLVLEAGGRFYFAKDSTLRPQDAQAYLGASLDRFRELRAELDPGGLWTSDLARRLAW